MGMQSLYTAATGMQAMETKLDVIANNLANSNTTAFKKDRANFEDLFYRQHRLPGALDADGNRTATGVEVGLGVRVSSTQTDFDQGSFESTGNQLDLAIQGNGFFAVTGPEGQELYTRSGNFNLNADGEIVLGSATTGFRLVDGITLPPDAQNVVISATGEVQFSTSTVDGVQTAGNITLTTFANDDGLLKLGDNLYRASDASGPANTGQVPNQQGVGALLQGTLESSNVEATTELIDLINTQRAFELNSQVIQAGDEIMQLIANLRS